MTTVGFIGSGNIGGTVAGLAVAAGHHVVLSNSRGPETLQDLVVAAVRDATRQAGELASDKLGPLTGGMGGLGGLGIPGL